MALDDDKNHYQITSGEKCGLATPRYSEVGFQGVFGGFEGEK
jgi:hypothetical protein